MPAPLVILKTNYICYKGSDIILQFLYLGSRKIERGDSRLHPLTFLTLKIYYTYNVMQKLG